MYFIPYLGIFVGGKEIKELPRVNCFVTLKCYMNLQIGRTPYNLVPIVQNLGNKEQMVMV